MARYEIICINEREKDASRPSCGDQGSKKLKGAFGAESEIFSIEKLTTPETEHSD